MMTGKKTLAAIVLAAMLLSLVPALPAEPSAAQTPVVEIRYPGWQTRYNATSENPLMAQGYYHEVLVPHTGTEVWVNITHSQMGATANETNTYSFLKNSTGFYDVLYGKYLDESRCSADANGTLFFVALEVVDKREVPSGAPLSMFPRTLWELEAAADGNIVYITDLEVEVTGLRFGRQTESILFRLEPYSFDQSGDLEIGRPTEGVVNTGNIPFHLEVDFGVYSPYFTATNTSRLVYPLEQVEVEITLNPTGWSPRSDSFWVRFVADYPGNMVLATAPAMIVFNNSYEIPANVRIEVRFAGYGLYQLGNQEVVMQYVTGMPNPLILNYQEERNLTIYLSGWRNLELAMSAENITIVQIEWRGDLYQPDTIPIISLNNETMAIINITVRGDFGGTDGWLTYQLSTNSGALTGSPRTAFFTNAPPYSPPATDEEEDFLRSPMGLAAIGGGMAVFVVLILLYVTKRKKEQAIEEQAREEKLQELLEKKAQREKARKEGRGKKNNIPEVETSESSENGKKE